MNCSQIEMNAIAYLDGKLARAKADAFRRHLAECSPCAERLRAFSDVSSLMDSWAPVEPSASFNARLQQRILSEPAAQGSWLDRLSLWLPAKNPLGNPALAGALLGMIVFAVGLARYAPGTSVSFAPNTTDTAVVASFEGTDELALYQDLPVLENLELLANFEVLQELQNTTP